MKIEINDHATAATIKAVEHSIMRCKSVIDIIDRKRSWRASEKAMAKVPYFEHLKALQNLLSALREGSPE